MNVILLPWYTILDFGLWCIPILLSFIFFVIGLELVDTVVEEPFGTDIDDLPLGRYSKTIQQSVAEIFADQSGDNSPIESSTPATIHG